MATFDEDRKARARVMSPGGTAPAPAPEMTNNTAPVTLGALKPAAAELAKSPKPIGDTPLDAQAASDRAAISSAWNKTNGAAESLVRGIADAGTMIPRGAAGVYDTMYTRPMRAFGVDAGYLKPKLTPGGADPSSWTPFTDLKQQGTTSAAETLAGPRAANVAQDKNPAANQGTPPAITTVTSGPALTDAQKQAAIQTTAQARLAAGLPPANSFQAAVTPTSTGAPPANNGYTDLGGGIYRKGNEFTDQTGMGDAKFAARGAPTAQNLAALNNVAAPQPGAQPGLGMGGREQAFQQLANLQRMNAETRAQSPTQPNIGRDVAGERNAQYDLENAMRKQPGESRSDYATRTNAFLKIRGLEQDERGNIRTNETQQRGQDVNANTAEQDRGSRERMEGGRQSIDAGRLGLQAMETGANVQTAGIKNRAATALADLQQQYLGAKTPEEQQTILSKYNALAGNGGQKTDVWGYAPGKQVVDGNGNVVDGSGVLFNKQTGETREVAKGGGSQALPPGMTRQVGTQNGVPVYEDAKGNRFIGG